jgi:hypothetical protein
VPGILGALVAAVATAALVGTPVFSFADDAIDESSSLVDLGALMVTTNDSGDDAVLYVIDGAGRTVGRTTYADEVEDVEALAPAAPDPGSLAPAGARVHVWAADIGDNRERRTSVQVYRVPVARGDRTVQAASYDLVYPDGPHDAESLLVGPDGRLRVVTKGILGGSVYVAPETLDADGPNRLVRGPGINLFATDAALFRDGRHVLVRGYGTALVATFPAFKPVAFLDLPAQEQGEGVSIGANGRIRLSSEGQNSDVLQVKLPDAVKKQLRKTSTGAPPVQVEDPVATRPSGRNWPLLLGGLAAVGLVGWVAVGRRR